MRFPLSNAGSRLSGVVTLPRVSHCRATLVRPERSPLERPFSSNEQACS
jgi:hypothetical protein